MGVPTPKSSGRRRPPRTGCRHPQGEGPRLGLGTYSDADRDQWRGNVRTALDVGFRHVDTGNLADEDPLYGDDAITPETVGRLCQYRRETEHTLNQGYWRAILDFADVHFDGA